MQHVDFFHPEYNYSDIEHLSSTVIAAFSLRLPSIFVSIFQLGWLSPLEGQRCQSYFIICQLSKGDITCM